MDKETELKHFLDDIETREEFAPVEYEGSFYQEGDQYKMGDTIRFIFDTEQVLVLSKEELLTNEGASILDILIKRIYRMTQYDVITLRDAESKKQELVALLCLKNERKGRQERNLYKSDKRLKHLEKEIRGLQKKLDEIERKIEVVSTSSPTVKLLILLRTLEQETQ
jgi:tetrahydromethanopterin S-methyltransferase subunit G